MAKFSLVYKDFLNQELVYTFEASDLEAACAAAEIYLQELQADFIRLHAGKNLRPGRTWFRPVMVAKIE